MEWEKGGVTCDNWNKLKLKNSEIIGPLEKKMFKTYAGEKNNTNNEEDHSGIHLSRV